MNRRVDSLDHLVLTVKDVQKTVRFYVDILGMQAREYIPGRFALHFGKQKINLHDADRIPDPMVKHAKPGSADLCFLSKYPIEDWMRELKEKGVRIIDKPVERIGAQGPIRSIYFYDPDENLVEISNLLHGD